MLKKYVNTLIAGGLTVTCFAQARAVAAKNISSYTSRAGMKIIRTHDCCWDAAASAFADQSKAAIVESWKTFNRPSSPFGTMAYQLLSNGDVGSLTVKSEGSEEDNFYYAQSLWESLPLTNAQKGFCAITLPEIKGEKEPESGKVFVHLIPAGVLVIYPGLFTDTEIRCNANCYPIDVNDANNKELQRFRRGWVSFCQKNRNPDRKHVQKESFKLKKILERMKPA